jgi:sugar phosphate isomerase/epimerase
MTSSPQILLSSDSLSGYGLDHIFEIASEVGFDGIDLATWKNYDARNESYVSKLSKKHDLPVRIIQVSSKVNTKEMEQAFDLCDTLDIDTIAINAPGTFNFKTFNFIVTNLKYYRKQ